MSASGTLVTAEHFAYVRARTTQEGEFLAALKTAAAAAGIPNIWISPEQAALMQILLRLSDAREVVEVGTLAGYSAIQMARALPPGGRVRTIEVESTFAAFAEDWIGRSDVTGRIEVCRGDARAVLPTFADGSADAAFIDADKVGYRTYVRECVRILRPGGLLMVDNAFAFGQLFDTEPSDPSVPDVRAFNEWHAKVPELQSVIVPIGDGCWVGTKVANPG